VYLKTRKKGHFTALKSKKPIYDIGYKRAPSITLVFINHLLRLIGWAYHYSIPLTVATRVGEPESFYFFFRSRSTLKNWNRVGAGIN